MDSSDFRCVVTGCNGYLGKALCHLLARRGLPVAGLCRAGRDVSDLTSAGIPCHGYDALARVVGAGDVVVHCAGRTGGGGTWADFEKTNVDLSLDLFRAAAEAKAAAFVYVSSVAALGYANRPGQDTLVEDDPPVLGPGELYGRSKLLAEQRLADAARGSSVRLIVLRPGLVYGTAGASGGRALEAAFVLDPAQRVPLVHVSNFADAVVLSAGVAEPVATFHVVDEEQPALGDLNRLKQALGLADRLPPRRSVGRLSAAYCARTLAKKLLRRATPVRGTLEATLRFHRRRSLYTTMKLREATGWRPRLSLVAGWEQAAGRSLEPLQWRPTTPARLAVWLSGGAADGGPAKLRDRVASGEAVLVGTARTREAAMDLQRRRHVDRWVVMADVADDLPQAVRSMAWGCRAVRIAGADERGRAALEELDVPGVDLGFEDL